MSDWHKIGLITEGYVSLQLASFESGLPGIGLMNRQTQCANERILDTLTRF